MILKFSQPKRTTMKKLIVSVLTIYVFVSCTTDDAVQAQKTNADFRPGFIQKNIINPENNNNAYDFVGALHAEILNDYLENNTLPVNLKDVMYDVYDTAVLNNDFVAINTGSSSLNELKVEKAIDNLTTPLNIVNVTNLSSAGKAKLTVFLADIDDLETMTLSDAVSDIIAFETTVTNDHNLTVTDNKIILRFTAIARYSLAYGEDRGWNKTKAGILASINTSYAAEAVVLSITANLVAQ